MQRRWQVLTVVSVAVFMVSLDLFIANVAFPAIRTDFDRASLAAVSWVLNAYAIVLAALMVPAGRLADRAGRRRAFLVGMLVFVAGSALCGAAWSIETLVTARVLQAAGAALLLPTSLALLLPEFSAAQRPAALGVWAAVGGVAAAAGPPLGGLLVELDWRLVFLVNVPIGLLAFGYATALLRESRDASQERPDLLGAAILTAAVGALALGLVKAPEWGWGAARTLVAIAGGLAGLGLFWLRCLAHTSPVVDPAMLRVRAFATASVASLLFSAAFAAMLLGTVLFMTRVWGESVLEAGVSLSAGPATAAVFAVLSGRFVNRLGQRALASTGMALFALGGLWWYWRLGMQPAYAAELLPGLLVSGLGVGLALPSLASAAAAALPPARFATGTAVFAMTRQLGYVLGVAILVALLGTGGGGSLASFDRGWLLMVVAAGAGAVAARAIGDQRRPKALPAAPAAAPAVSREPTGQLHGRVY
jgi:EmrB/QacA subfamily drug resistance transporter